MFIFWGKGNAHRMPNRYSFLKLHSCKDVTTRIQVLALFTDLSVNTVISVNRTDCSLYADVGFAIIEPCRTTRCSRF